MFWQRHGLGMGSAVPTAGTQAASTFYAHPHQPNRHAIQKGLAWVILQLQWKPEVCCERGEQICKGFWPYMKSLPPGLSHSPVCTEQRGPAKAQMLQVTKRSAAASTSHLAWLRLHIEPLDMIAVLI